MTQNVQQNIETWKVKLDKALHEKNAFTDILDKIEKKTKVSRLYLVMGLGAFLGLYLMIGYGAQFLCNFLGFLYPAYASVKAIESKQKDDDTKWLTYWVTYAFFSLLEFFTDIFLFWIPFYWFFKEKSNKVQAIESVEKDDDTKWLTYWVVYSVFSLVEQFTDIFFSWIPFYYLVKCVFLVYCMVPTSWNGSITIYNKVIRPFVLRHQTKVDQALDKAAGAAQEVISEAEAAAKNVTSDAINQQFQDATKMD